MKIKKQIFPLLISLFLFSVSTSINTLGPLINVDATGRFSFYDEDTSTYIPTTPNGLTVTGYTDTFNDGDLLDFSTWVFEVSVSEGVALTEYFNGDSGDFGDYFNVSVMRNGVLTTISNFDPLYYVDTEMSILFNDGSNPLEFTFNIFVNTIDPVFTKYDLPDEFSGLEVATNGHDSFIEGDTITFSNWTFSVTLMSGTQVFVYYSDVYLTISDPGTLDASVSDVIVEFQVFDIYMISFVGIYVEYVPDYSIIIATPPDQLVYFVDDAIDFTNLLIDLYDDAGVGYIDTLDSSSAGISFTNGFGDEIIQFDFLTLNDTEIIVYYDDGNGFGASISLSLTIHPFSYRYDFTSSDVSAETVSESLPNEVSFGDINDVWIVSGESTDEENPAVQTASNNDNFGLIFGDSLTGNYPASISLMSKHLWGVYGSAGQDVGDLTSGEPIIQNVYVKAFTSLGGSADFSIKINNVLLYTHVVNDVEPSTDEWYTFTTADLPPQIGHIEFVINVDAAVPAVVYLQEIVIDSNNDSINYPSLSPMLKFASDMESLDTCANQEEFLETNQSLYQSYLDASDIDGIFENLLLLDHLTTGDAKSQLVVTTVNKWNMMVTQYVDMDESGPPVFASDAITNTNHITLHFVLGGIFILIQLFWIGRRFSFFDREIKQ